MSCGLLVRRGYERSEADVRHELISLLLKRVARSMSEIVLPATNPEEQEYASSFVVKSTTERPRVKETERESGRATILDPADQKMV